jgi:dimethylargininase
MTDLFGYTNAIVRTPGASVVGGIRHGNGANPELTALLAEHETYVETLLSLGVKVDVLPALDAFPDSVFVEDVALVLPEGAIQLKPGAPSRAGEVDEIGMALDRHFDTVLKLSGPGHVDGGDILALADRFIIGLSERTDQAGAQQLVALLDHWGLKGQIADTPSGVLHFKTGCSLIDQETVLAVPAMINCPAFSGLRVVETPEGEAAAANLIRVCDHILIGNAFPETRELITRLGIETIAMPVREIAKIDAGLSCMSLRWRMVK